MMNINSVSNISRPKPIAGLATGSKTLNYVDLTRYLSEDTFRKLDAIDNAQKVDQLCQAITKGDYKTLDCTDPDLLFLGLKAVKEERLSVEDFAMASIYWGIRKHHTEDDIQIITLFDSEGKPNARAKEIISETMKVSSVSGMAIQGAAVMFTAQQIDTFFEQLSLRPKSQQRFFVMSDIESIRALQPQAGMQSNIEAAAPGLLTILQRMVGIMTISQSIYSGAIGINVFSRFTEEQKEMRMFPSWNMVQTFLNIKFGAQAVTAYPTIDYAPNEEIEQNGRTGRRVASMPFHDLQYTHADTFAVRQDYDMLYHDFVYHCIRASYVPPSHQKAFILVAEAAKQIITKYELYQPYPQLLYERFIDMELPYFQLEPTTFFDALTFILNPIALQGTAVEFQKRISPEAITTFRNGLLSSNRSTTVDLINEYERIRVEVTLKLDQLVASGYTVELAETIVSKRAEFESLGIQFTAVTESIELVKAAVARNTTSFSPENREIAEKANFYIQIDKAMKSAST